ncbi:MAG TPA: YihY/virulence factor BrkB family protein, partial [Tepidisphaeraceae bacterium]
AMTMSALDKCYEVVKFRPFYLQRFIAIVMTIVVAVLMILVVTLLPVAGLLKAWMLGKGFLQEGDFLLIAFDVVRWLLSLLLMFTMLSLIYFWGPSIRQKWQSITPGAVFCVVVWIVLGLAFRFYINKFAHYEKTYGTVGGVAVLLLFFYIDAVVLLIGAEINSEIDFAIGVPRGASDFRGAILQAAAKRLQEKGQIPPDAKPEPQELKAEAAKVIQTLKREGEADLLQPEKKVEELKEKVDDAARKN